MCQDAGITEKQQGARPNAALADVLAYVVLAGAVLAGAFSAVFVTFPDILMPLFGGPTPAIFSHLNAANVDADVVFESALVLLMLPGFYITFRGDLEKQEDEVETVTPKAHAATEIAARAADIPAEQGNGSASSTNTTRITIHRTASAGELFRRADSWSRRRSRRISCPSSDEDEATTRKRSWASSFADCDPRKQILRYFDDVAQEGVKRLHTSKGGLSKIDNLLLKAFPVSSVFSVWRPTSPDAIRKLMMGEGTGKGLDIKGKSSKEGSISGYVPFLQIHLEEDKDRIRSLERDATLSIFFKDLSQRDEVISCLVPVALEMEHAVIEAKKMLQIESIGADDKVKAHFTIDKWDMARVDNAIKECNYISKIDEPQAGIELPENLFWEAFVKRQDISRTGEYASGRPSAPAFMDMNLATMRTGKTKSGISQPVVLQLGHAFCPQSLVIAYKEHGRIVPVVSDFDCFLVGTRNVEYTEPLPEEQIDVLEWMLDNIERILRKSAAGDSSWTSEWLEVLKASTLQGFYPKIPPLGFGDPTSYLIMEHAVGRLRGNGAVRHGAECFNYYFPQDLDEEFLIVSDRLPGKVPWKYVNCKELQDLLIGFADQGFTFPMNPKWLLCDEGWMSIFNKLAESDKSAIKQSLEVWYPPHIRRRILDISAKFPSGYQKTDQCEESADKAEKDLAEFELEHFITMNTKTLFEKIGGDKAIEKAVDEFYRRVVVDPLLEPFFRGIRSVSRIINGASLKWLLRGSLQVSMCRRY